MPQGRTTWSLLCLAVLAITLSLGLWPFCAPPNDVKWLTGRAGIEFGRFSVATGTDPVKAVGPVGPGTTIEVWLRPRNPWGKGTILGYSAPRDQLRLRLRQSGMDLEIRADSALNVVGAFDQSRPTFLTVTSDQNGTSIYTDGVLVKDAPGFHLSVRQFTGQLTVGDAPGQTDSWRGQLYGLALYHCRLELADVRRHYLNWTLGGSPRAAQTECIDALYLFQEHAGNLIHNSVNVGLALQIPERYTVVNKIMLEPFWGEFSLSSSYLSAAVKNIVGFVPLGFCFCGYLRTIRCRRKLLITILIGATVSVTIEVLQGWLPTRDSGTTDIFTNTLGTWIGVASYNMSGPILVRVLCVDGFRRFSSMRSLGASRLR